MEANNLICKTCDKQFKFQSSLSRHGRVHKHLRLVCDCGISFARRDSLKRHERKCGVHKYVPISTTSSNTEDAQVISDICYNQICGDYWHANYLGLQVIMMKSNGYINASKLCMDGGKLLKHWLENKNSKEMMRYCENAMNQSDSSNSTFPTDLALGGATAGIPAVAGGNANNVISPNQSASIPSTILITGGDDMAVRGTYVCSKLIPHIASWVSIEFGYRVACIIEDFVVRDYQERLNKEKDKASELCKLHDQKVEKLENVDKELTKWGSTHAFTMLRLNDVHAKMPYYAIRCVRQLMNGRIKKIRAKYPNSVLIYQQRYCPNAVNLFTKLKATKAIKAKRCYCRSNVTESKLIDTLGSLYGVAIKPDFTIPSST